ncbi:unnamed protein product [Heterobilharzia americana]|nr:unnamed protein product [Heterobilharzia americana]
MWKETCITVLGRKKKKKGDKESISTNTWKLIEEGEEDGNGESEDEPVQGRDEQRKEELNTTHKTLHWTKT